MKIENIELGLGDAGNRVFLWQYDNALRLIQVLKNEIEYYNVNVSQYIQDWEQDVFSLSTANGFGLNVWGAILGAKRISVSPQNYIVDSENTLRLWNPNTNLWHAIWLSGDMPTLNIEANGEKSKFNPILLDDETYRRSLFAKLYLMYSDASIHSINEYLHRLFPHLNAYVKENVGGVMTMSIVFRDSVPSDNDLTILTSNEFSPRPVGVYIDTGVERLESNIFSFQEQSIETMGETTYTTQAYENSFATWGTNTSTSEEIAKGLGTFYNL